MNTELLNEASFWLVLFLLSGGIWQRDGGGPWHGTPAVGEAM